MLDSYLDLRHPVPLTEQVAYNRIHQPHDRHKTHAQEVIREFNSLFHRP